ncbi:capsule polysaccharide export protein [Legionella oakridgensis RV-2-2007]|nr:capsule polysaccharide export protein [Legionella oakridgensis RV-2-2007]
MRVYSAVKHVYGVLDFYSKKFNIIKKKIHKWNERRKVFLNQNVSKNFDSNKETFFIWGIPPQKQPFFRNFFEDGQVFFIKNTNQFNEINAILNVEPSKGRVVAYNKHFSSARKFSKANNMPIIYLRPGIIGHPNDTSVTACFLDKFTNEDTKKFDFNVLYSILNNESLSSKIIEQAHQLRQLYKALRIGRGGSPGFINTKKFLGPRLKKRVLIISTRNKWWSKWNKKDLLKLAILENPNAEIYLYNARAKVKYRVLRKATRIKNYIYPYKVITKSIRITDMIMECDHIYTDHSVHAIDAIFHEKKLTVTGEPFYCGWGLTDDRAQRPENRHRTLTVDEFFALLFFKCTRYCYDNHDTPTALLSTMLDVAGTYEYEIVKALPKTLKNSFAFQQLCESDYWPIVFDLWKTKRLSKNEMQTIKSNLNLSLSHCGGKKANHALIAAIVGLTIDKPAFESAMVALKRKIPADDITAVLQERIKLLATESSIKEIANFLANEREWEKSHELLECLLDMQQEHYFQELKQSDNDVKNSNKLVQPESYDTEFNLAKLLITQKQYDKAEHSLYKLLLSGFVTREIFFQLAEIAKSTFQFEDALILYKILFAFEKPGLHIASQRSRATVCYYKGEALNLIKCLSIVIKHEPSAIIDISSNKDLLQKDFGSDFLYERVFFNASKNRLSIKNRNETEILALAQTCMMMEEFEEQIRLLEGIDNPQQIMQYNQSLLGAYTLSGQFDKARLIAEELLYHFPTLPIFQDAVKLAIRMDDYQWADQLFQHAEMHNIKKFGIAINEVLYRKYCFAKNEIHKAYDSYKNIAACHVLAFCLKDKYFQSVSECTAESILVLGFFGPGDEIRFASLYSQMNMQFPNKKVSFTCDPRLYDLFCNSYPQLNFIPVARQRKLGYKLDMSQYNQLPTLELHLFFDNFGWQMAQEFKAVTLATNLLGDIIENKNSIKGCSYLYPEPVLKTQWQKRLQSKRIKIGLSWRSSLVTYSRSEHYLTIEDLKPLIDAFSGGEVEFFNFQYDNVQEELSWVNEHCATKLINFDDLDQYNDLSSVAALMTCMDLMIAPATTVVELAGALGCLTFMLSNSSELHWRKLDESTKRDVWHHSVFHIEGDQVGDKQSLVKNLIEAVERFVLEHREAHSQLVVKSEDIKNLFS